MTWCVLFEDFTSIVNVTDKNMPFCGSIFMLLMVNHNDTKSVCLLLTEHSFLFFLYAMYNMIIDLYSK